MKRYVAIGAILAASALAFAQPVMPFWGGYRIPDRILTGPYASAEFAAIKSELGARPFGELSLDQLAPYWNRMETAVQKDIYLKTTSLMSLAMPGAGQFRNGDGLAGAGF